MTPALLILILALAGVFILWLLIRNGVITPGKHTGVVVALSLGVLGMAIPIMVLAGNGDTMIQVGVMISGAILFGGGIIAAAILATK